MRPAGSCVWGSVTTSAGRSDPVPPLVAPLLTVDVGTFYEAHRDQLLGFALLLVGDPHAAEDLLHEAVAGALARSEPPDDPGAYLRTAMANRARSRWRRRAVVRRADSLLPRGDDLFEHPPDVALWDLVRRLPDRPRAVLTLRFVDRRTNAEIAELLDLPLGTVASIVVRTLQRLRLELAELEEP
jgi:RNA polymerase sigma-70 factor, ECF subfamily